jgi:hypothetical protein
MLKVLVGIQSKRVVEEMAMIMAKQRPGESCLTTFSWPSDED